MWQESWGGNNVMLLFAKCWNLSFLSVSGCFTGYRDTVRPCLPHYTVATTSSFLWWSTLSSFLKQIFYSNSIKQSFCFEVNWIEGNNHNILLSDILFKEVLMLLFNSQFDCFIKQLSSLFIFPHQLTFFINQLSMSINLFDF